MFKCDLCDKSYQTARGMYQHYFKTHHLYCKNYYDKFLIKTGEGICSNPNCNNKTRFINGIVGYAKYCSCKCATNDESYKNNKIDNCLKIHGVRSTNNLPEVKKKKEETCIKNHGVKSPWQSKEIYEKAQKTYIKNHGHLNNFSDPLYRKKVEEINLERYGVKSYSQTEEFKNNVLKTDTGKYTMETEEFKEKSRKTKLERYGNEYWLNPEKIKETTKERYGVENCMQNHDIFKKTKKHLYYNNLSFSSLPELCYYIWLNDNNIPFEYQPDVDFVYEYKGIRHYNPDFKVGEEIVEIKGLHFFENHNPNGKMVNPYGRKDEPEKVKFRDELMEAKHQCMLKNGVKIITDFSVYIKYVKIKYGKNYLENFRKNN